MSLVTTRLAVAEMVTDIMQFVMSYSLPPNPLHSDPLVKPAMLFQTRPADILLPTWHGGRPAALDVHIISPLQQSTIHEAAYTPGHVLLVGTQRKLTTRHADQWG